MAAEVELMELNWGRMIVNFGSGYTTAESEFGIKEEI